MRVRLEAGLPVLAPAPADALSRGLAQGQIGPATYALERASSLFALDAVRARFGDVQAPDPHLATLYLRDLAVRQHELVGEARVRAATILARPTDGGNDGFGAPKYRGVAAEPAECRKVCVHYVTDGTHAVRPRDRDPDNGVPDFVDQVVGAFDSVWQTEIVEMGYRKPLSDLTSKRHGPDGKLDVYLADIGSQGIFGYCTTDDPNWRTSRRVSAYCVLDNDYRNFGYADPLEPMRVTAAHEFFHGVQFAYDVLEDAYFMEGTATWIEDEVFDGIDDNLFYLFRSPLSHPAVPLDRNAGLRVYGSWIWFRFLSEYFRDPGIIRSIWGRAIGVRPSTQAAVLEIGDRKLNGQRWRFRWAFADFGAWNIVPKRFYEEGKRYPAARTQSFVTLSGSRRSFATSAKQHHLTNRYAVIKRGTGISSTAKLRVAVDGPALATGTEATLVVVRKTGAVRLFPYRIDVNGNGVRKVAFDGGVARVVVVTTNASTRFKQCGTDPRWTYTCAGVPVDDGRVFRVQAQVVG